LELDPLRASVYQGVEALKRLEACAQVDASVGGLQSGARLLVTVQACATLLSHTADAFRAASTQSAQLLMD
jgi:hypothetical protein